jgi:hypothetical protein
MFERQIEMLVTRFVNRDIRPDEFSRQFASLYFSIWQDATSSQAANRLCNQIIGPLAELRGVIVLRNPSERSTPSSSALLPSLLSW